MSIKRFATKRDANEPLIIEYLERRGFSVHPMDQPLDLLVGRNQKTYLVEVKTEKGKLTKTQKDFLKLWRGQFAIVRDLEQAKIFCDEIILKKQPALGKMK